VALAGSFGEALNFSLMATHFLKNPVRWHLLAWLSYAVYVLLDAWVSKEIGGKAIPKNVPMGEALWLDASFLVVRIAVFYYCYLLLFPYLLRVPRLPQLVLGLGSTVLVFAGVRAGIEEVMYPALLGFHNYDGDTTIYQYLFDSLYYTVPNIVLCAAIWGGEEALRRERENRQLTTEKRAAELAFLKTQINPHFLFNTLNMLYGLAYGVDKTLAGGLLKLSSLLRYMLRDTPDGLVDLAEEVEYLDNFLDLYRLRYPGRLYAELTVVGDPTRYRVAPLLLIPLVENAFKHGVLDDPAAPVHMRLALGSGVVEFTVENQPHAYLTGSDSGIGLPNLHRRLELLYPRRYAWQVGLVGGQFRAYLRLDVPISPGAVATADPRDARVPVLAAVTTV
jgi:two-component system LytT family sensor kinase